MAKDVLAQDIMSTNVVTIQPSMSCDDLQQLMVKNKISGVPVVDKEENLVGVISMFDILRKDVEIIELDNKQVNKDLLQWLRKGIVSDFMNRQVYTAGPGTPVKELADIMFEKKIHRVVILKPGTRQIAGMVTTFDLLKLISEKNALA